VHWPQNSLADGGIRPSGWFGGAGRTDEASASSESPRGEATRGTGPQILPGRQVFTDRHSDPREPATLTVTARSAEVTRQQIADNEPLRPGGLVFRSGVPG